MLRPQGHEQPSPDGAWTIGSALRALAGVILIVVLIRAAIMVLVGLVAQSDRWHLPNGELLEATLSSCQFEHSRRAGIDAEQMICPTRLAARDFPRRAARGGGRQRGRALFRARRARLPVQPAAPLGIPCQATEQGGSTITQQLARSLLLKKEDKFERKLLEAVLAIRIFGMLPRAEILTRYLNAVPHARNMHGFDDPARYYFGVGVQDLTLAEAALLVGMLPEPNNRDPVKNPTDAFNSAVAVLHRMRAQGKISADQAADAEHELRRRVFGGNLRRGDRAMPRIEYRPYRDLALREAKENGIALAGDYRLIVFIDAGLQAELLRRSARSPAGIKPQGSSCGRQARCWRPTGSCTYTGEWNRATDIERSIGSTGKLFPLIGVHEAGVSLSYRFSDPALAAADWPAEPNSAAAWRPGRSGWISP